MRVTFPSDATPGTYLLYGAQWSVVGTMVNRLQTAVSQASRPDCVGPDPLTARMDMSALLLLTLHSAIESAVSVVAGAQPTYADNAALRSQVSQLIKDGESSQMCPAFAQFGAGRTSVSGIKLQLLQRHFDLLWQHRQVSVPARFPIAGDPAARIYGVLNYRNATQIGWPF